MGSRESAIPENAYFSGGAILFYCKYDYGADSSRQERDRTMNHASTESHADRVMLFFRIN